MPTETVQSTAEPTAGNVRRPNVLLLHCHDLGRHLNVYGAKTVSSPRLDAFAADAVIADQMYATAPQCSPSRAGLFTGRWPHHNGVLGLTHDIFGWDLHADEQHLAARLRRAGYRTELVGQHHESRRLADDQVAARLGFDRVQAEGLGEVVVERTTDALRRLAAADEPFYLQAGFSEPHRRPGERDAPGVMGFIGNHLQPDDSRGVEVPGYLADTESAREEIAELQGAIKFMDDCAGRVLDELDRLGLAENTITIFTTDHGLALPRAKCSLYDPGLEVAFMIRWPAAGWTGGVHLEPLLLNLDVTPTLLVALGLEQDGPAGAPAIDGRSFLPLLPGEQPDGEASGQATRGEVFGELTYHDYYDPKRSVRTQRHKLIVNFTAAPKFMDPSQSWVRRCIPVHAPNGNIGHDPIVELYDLAEDPYELRNRADDPALAEVRADLLARLGSWMAATDDPLLAGAVTSPAHRFAVAELQPATAP
ncbi:sulfatase [Microlunatus elymi]|uniref:Sulfatase n=1 Tax=Microlunatus elymi TaxID=2596828 RepID=A0A516PTZ3_9ACTN|nr:sulfatase [Microlunatus elymi]QDP94648.1 sulfatase [Microlunatus elymi]